MSRGLALIVGLLPSVAIAEGVLTPQEFESRVTGKTLTYSTDGTPYGAEEYFEGRRVRWTFLDGECQEGRWYVAGDQICFVYDNMPDPQCWTFYAKGPRLTARFSGDMLKSELYETSKVDEPLMCLGPKVGV